MIDWALAGTIILSGIIVVLFAMALFSATASMRGRLSGTPQAQPAVMTAPAAAPVIEAGIPRETVAVISAAIAAFMEDSSPGTAYTVKSIGRVRSPGVRPVWGFAGMRQNTEPF